MDSSLGVSFARLLCSESGSELFLGECFSSTATNRCAAAGTGTAPLRTISLALIFLP